MMLPRASKRRTSPHVAGPERADLQQRAGDAENAFSAAKERHGAAQGFIEIIDLGQPRHACLAPNDERSAWVDTAPCELSASVGRRLVVRSCHARLALVASDFIRP